jgi:hypothetical protein
MPEKKILVFEALGVALTPESRVDLEKGVIYGAKVLGRESKNKRRYPAELVRKKHKVYEGAQVFANHDYQQLKTGKARPLQDWGGVVRDVTEKGGEAFGDVHCLKETQAGRIILEAADRCPDKFGLSPMHHIEVEKGADGIDTVLDIIECWSVDAVTRPATTRTLFEEEQVMADTPAAAPAAAAGAGPMSLDDAFAALSSAIMADQELADNDRVDFLKDIMKVKTKWLSAEDDQGSDEGTEGAGGEGGGAGGAAAGESHRRPAPRKSRLDRIEEGNRRLAIRLMAGESVHVDETLMQTLLALPEPDVAARLQALKDARRPAGRTARSGHRQSTTVAAEEHQRAAAGAGGTGGGAGKKVPSLSEGADREAVRRFYTQG